MRLGTGYGVEDILRRRKYYKYRMYDDQHGFARMTIGVREFCKLLAAARCEYCDSTSDVGMDRVDNRLGHAEENVVWACSLCNMTRGNRFTVAEMREIGHVIKKIRNGR